MLAALLSFAYMVSMAQNSILKVIDANNKKEIPFINIQIKSITSNFNDVKISDIHGHLNNIYKEKSLITISQTGYITKIDTLLPNQSMTFELETDFFNLEQVTITGTRTEKMLKDVSVLTQVITSEQMVANDAIDIEDALSIAIPNVNFKKSTSGKRLDFGGLEAKYILFLVDGEKIAGETNGNIDYDRFNSYNIERIEIIKGAASSLYGSNAISGVVNIITKKTEQKIEVTTGSRYSILKSSENYYGELDFHTNIGAILKKISFRTDYHQKSNDGFVLNSNENYFLTPYNTKKISQKIQYKPINKLNITLKGNYYIRDRLDAYTLSPKKDKNISYGINGLYKLPKKNNISLSFHSDIYNTFFINQFYNNKETLQYSNKYDNARIISNINIGSKQLFIIGSEFINESLFSDRIEDNEKQTKNIVTFLQDDINFSKKINTTIGLRFDWHSEYNFHFTPNISFMYKLAPFNFRLNYGIGFKAPTLKELYMDFSPLPIVKVNGNPELIPETSHYYSISTEFTKAMINTSISVYQNRVTNMITEVQDVDNPIIWTYENINNVIVSGIDFSLRAKLNYGLSITTGYSYTDSEDTSRGQQLLGASKNSGFMTLGNSFQVKKYKMSINLQSKYIDKMSYEEMDDISGKLTTKYFKAHSMWKITTTHTFFNGIIITVGIDNIFNYTEIQNITSLNPGRNFFIGANINFHKLNINNKILKK